MSEDHGLALLSQKAEVAPSQLKPGEFQNNDGSGSQMGRWTREEHMKFVKCKYLARYQNIYSSLFKFSISILFQNYHDYCIINCKSARY